MNPEDVVSYFNKTMGQPDNVEMTPELLAFRFKLIAEEYVEVRDEFAIAMTEPVVSVKTKARLTKELADLLYVVYGAAATFGIPITAAFQRVHQSNLSKLDDEGKPVYREDGKVVKGPNYRPPNMESLFE